MQKKVLAIHDVSCVGRCSLTVALPIISACGIECSVLPTAVLSTHTGGFTGYTFRDLTDDIDPIAAHWRTLGLRFDGIYSGFLGSQAQIAKVGQIIGTMRQPGGLACVDPCMADNGKLYALFDMDYARAMAGLCRQADLIVPNITEACLLTGRQYREGPYDPAYVEAMLKDLSALGPRQVILTGVYYDDRRLGAACYDREGGIGLALADRLPGYYHGTGDIFASAAFSALVAGRTLDEANRIAVTYTQACIDRTYRAGTDSRYGVQFEPGLAALAAMVGTAS